MLRRQLIRTLGATYIFNGEETSYDPRDRFFSPEEKNARMRAIIEQHPNAGIAAVYRQELGIDVNPAP